MLSGADKNSVKVVKTSGVRGLRESLDVSTYSKQKVRVFLLPLSPPSLKFFQSATDTGKTSWRGACQRSRRAGGS